MWDIKYYSQWMRVQSQEGQNPTLEHLPESMVFLDTHIQGLKWSQICMSLLHREVTIGELVFNGDWVSD